MKRRIFIKNSAITALGAVLFPTVFTGCRKDPIYGDHDFEGKVIIIGAGAAGLYAGYNLRLAGVNFEILEASGVAGGRLRKNTSFTNVPIDLGAQWIHGQKALMKDFADEHKFKTRRDNMDFAHYWYNNAMSSSLPSEFRDFSKLLEKSSGSLPDISILDYAIQQSFGTGLQELANAIAGEAGTSADRLSAKYNAVANEEWSAGAKCYLFETQSYFDLVNEHITKPIQNNIFFNTIVTKIDYSGSQIEITDSDGATYLADRVIVTTPITILKDGDIEFVPALPAEKTNAFQKIGMDKGIKVFLKFSEKFWGGTTIGSPVAGNYLYDGHIRESNDKILISLIMGSKAEAMEGMDEQQITEALLTELDLLFNNSASSSFIESHVQNWGEEPFIRGAYSYQKVGIGNARADCLSPVDDLIYFAGEAFNHEGHHATVHGAAETGYNQVLSLLGLD